MNPYQALEQPAQATDGNLQKALDTLEEALIGMRLGVEASVNMPGAGLLKYGKFHGVWCFYWERWINGSCVALLDDECRPAERRRAVEHLGALLKELTKNADALAKKAVSANAKLAALVEEMKK